METAWSVLLWSSRDAWRVAWNRRCVSDSICQKMIFIWIVLSSVIRGIAFGWKRNRKYLFPAAVGLFVWIGLWRWKEICEGICRSMERMTEAVNAYYQCSHGMLCSM